MKREWRVLIADDEPIIREGIRDSVDWEALHMKVVEEAEDGEEALELVLHKDVDIVLADLNMPIMDGITFIKELRKERPECRVIIVTGHDEFSYAQEAIRLHVDEYILKPAEPAQLSKVLGRIEKELEEATVKERQVKLASAHIQKNYPLLRERFCLKWIEGQLREQEISEQLQFLQLPEVAPTVFAMFRWAEQGVSQQTMKEKDRQLLLYAIENIVSEYVSPWTYVLFRDPMDLLVLCVWGEVPDELFPRVEQSVKKYLKLRITQHFEYVQGGLTQIPEIYRNTKTILYREAGISPIAKRARQYITEHFADKDITLEQAAHELQVSPVYLSRLLKQELGSTFISILTQTRIKKAIQLLHGTDCPIYEIAERVGYETQHYFSTAFKKMTGVSPIQYRKGGSCRERVE
jgi:two-component system, response regulator YesN